MLLNKQQQAAVDSNHPTIKVIAGAGSGKTRVIVERVVRIMTEKLATPDEVVIITFTRKAAEEIKSRIAERVGVKQATKMHIGTIHSYFLEILRDHATTINFRTPFTVLTEAEAELKLKEFHTQMKVKTSFAKISGMIEHYYNAGVINDEAKAIHNTYLAWLKSINAIDYGMILVYAWDVLCQIHNEFRKFVKYLFVDEFQDTNSLQYRLITLIKGNSDSVNLFIVGDPMQSIYEWRGAEPMIFSGFNYDYDCEVHALPTNYRSTQNIINVANRVSYAGNGLRLDTPNDEGEQITSIGFESEEEQCGYIIEQVKLMQIFKQDINNCAILYRAHFVGDMVERKLIEAGIPVNRIVSESSFWHDPLIFQTLSRIRAEINPWDNYAAYWACYWSNPFIDSIARNALIENEPLSQVVKKMGFEFIPGASEIGVTEKTDAVSVLEKIKTLYAEAIPGDSKEAVEFVQGKLEKFKSLLKIAEGKTVKQFLKAVALRTIQDSMLDVNNKPGINLMTIHAAKGLEWDNVFVIGLEEGVFPNRRKSGNIDEELRLFYVAITRARKKLYCLYTKQRLAMWQLFKPQKLQPSTFLTFLDEAK